MSDQHPLHSRRCSTVSKTMGSPAVLHTAAPRSCWPHQMLEWPSKGTAATPAQRQYSERMECCPSGCSTCRNQSPPYGAVSQIGRTHGSKNQGVEEGGVALLIITLNDSFRESVLPTHTTLSSVKLEIQVSKRAHACQRTQQRSY